MGVPLDVEVDRVDATKALFCMTDANIVITGKVPRIQSIGTKSRIPVLRYRKSIVLLYLSFSRILLRYSAYLKWTANLRLAYGQFVPCLNSGQTASGSTSSVLPKAPLVPKIA